MIRKNQFDAALRAGGGFAAQLFHGFKEIPVALAAGFQLQKAAVGAALLLQVAEGGDVAVLEDQHFVAALFHVPQKVRGKDQVQVAAVADFLDELDHANAGGRVKTVGGLIEEQELRA